jgi:hypothetical protein
MACKSCGASNQRNFTGEIAIHFPGLNNIDKPAVFVFPEILFCPNCGYAEFAVPENQIRLLANGGAGSSCETNSTNPFACVSPVKIDRRHLTRRS